MRNIHLPIMLLIGMYCSPLSGRAQQDIRPLSVGDTLPSLPFLQAIHYGQDSLRLSDFKGKLLILDFWNTWCTACLAGFPKLHQLQEKYGHRVRILPVVSSRGGSRQQYLDFYRMREEMDMPIGLPSIVEDSILARLFPHQSLPHVVWIGKDGVVRGITEGKVLTEENIQKMLADDAFMLPHRDSIAVNYMDYSIRAPLSLREQEGLVRKSILAKNLPIRYSHNLHISRDSLHTRVTFVGTRLPYLFVQLFEKRHGAAFVGKGSQYAKKHIFCETADGPVASAIAFHNDRDPQKYRYGPKDFYTYELVLDGQVRGEDILDAMLVDLNACFGVDARLEKRRVTVLEVFVDDRKKIPWTRYSGGRGFEEYTLSDDRQQFVCTNRKVSAVINSLNSRSDLPFLWDETGLEEEVDLDITWSRRHKVKSIRKELKKNGLGIRRKRERLDVLVIR